MPADFGLVPDGFAEAVEKEEGAAAVWTCRGLMLPTVNNSAEPARRSAACPCRPPSPSAPSSIETGTITRSAPQSGLRQVIFPANEQTKIRFAGGIPVRIGPW